MLTAVRSAVVSSARRRAGCAATIPLHQVRWESLDRNIKNKSPVSFKIDHSKVPRINEKDIEECFISGSGPGGQSVNKAVNCCQIKHKPTGLVIKVHQFRSLEQNRKIARELLAQKLDNLYNGENSVDNQKKRVALYKMTVRENQAEKRRAMKEQFKRTLAITKQRYDMT